MSEEEYTTTSTNSDTRKTPYNELELQYMVTEPAWGREATKELYKKASVAINQAYYACNICSKAFSKGETCPFCKKGHKILVIDKEPLWGLLSYYTRDFRLGNLSVWNNEIDYCHHWLALAGDLLRTGHIKSFLTALSRVIDRLEISQSRGGFLRRRMGTVTTEQWSNKDELAPKDKNLLNGKNKNTR